MCQHKRKYADRDGSIYLVTLVTIAAIVSMVLIGMSLRSSSNEQSTLTEQMLKGSNGVLNAAEYSIEKMVSDPQWRTNAKKGTILNAVAFGDGTYTSTVVDADTDLIPTFDTTAYRVTATSTLDTARVSASIEIQTSEVDYVAALKSYSAKHYWALDEHSSPSTAFDLIGNYDGTYLVPSVAASSTNDEGGIVPVFANANDNVSVPWGKDFKLKNGSVSLWMHCTGAVRSEYYSLLGMDCSLNGVPTLSVGVWYYGIDAYIDDDKVYGVQNHALTNTDSIDTNRWYHIVVTWGSGGLKVYIDGVLSESNLTNLDGMTTAGAGAGGEQPLYIGGGFDTSTASTPKEGFDGSVAHVAFFDKQLTGLEIAELAAIKPDLQKFSLVGDSWARVFE